MGSNQIVPEVRNDTNYTHVTKVWGTETWVINNELYCGKMLTVLPGHHTSMHFHALKHETMLCTSGSFTIYFIDGDGQRVKRTIGPGESIIIPPHTMHEIWGDHNAEVNMLFEFSTQHFDSDSYRVSPPG